MARIPALLLGLRAGDVVLRRALVSLRADLGMILLDLADEAARTLLAHPRTGRSELSASLARHLDEIDASRLGRSFSDLVDAVVADASVPRRPAAADPR